jgi:hypothetical protein
MSKRGAPQSKSGLRTHAITYGMMWRGRYIRVDGQPAGLLQAKNDGKTGNRRWNRWTGPIPSLASVRLTSRARYSSRINQSFNRISWMAMMDIEVWLYVDIMGP